MATSSFNNLDSFPLDLDPARLAGCAGAAPARGTDERIQHSATGQVVLKLKTPWRAGTTHLMMSSLELVPRRIELPL
ncbi:MAG: hypothetical protein OEY03_09640 [Rhizobacter sp.]|nr:hypothetical protein [Rhizobacter sp.]